MTPADLTELRGWWRPEGLAAYAEGASVDPWPDDSGLGNDWDLIAGFAGKQLGLLNGLHGVQIGVDGGGFFVPGRYTFPDCSLGTNNASEIWMVLKVYQDPSVFSGGGAVIGNADNSAFGNAYPYIDGDVFLGYCSQVRHAVGNPTPTLAVFHILRIRSANGEFTVEIDGNVIYTTATNTFFDPGDFLIGYDTRFAGQLFWLMETFATDNLLDSTKSAGMYEYLNAKFFGNTFTTANDGDHENGATWVGGVAPVSADDAHLIILHDVALNSDFTARGMTISETYAVKTGNTLATTGSIELNNTAASLTIGEDSGGAGLDLGVEASSSSSVAGSSSSLGAEEDAFIKVTGSGTLFVRGTAANRSLIRSVGPATGYVEAVKCDVRYGQWENLGNLTLGALHNLPAGFSHIIQHNVFDANCGNIKINSQGATDGYSITHNRFTAPGLAGQVNLHVPASTNPNGGVVREIKHNCFSRPIAVDTKDIIDHDNFYFGTGARGNTNFSPVFAGPPAQFDRPLIRHNGEFPATGGSDGLHLGHINLTANSWAGAGVMINDGNSMDWWTGRYTNATEHDVYNPHWFGGNGDGVATLYTRYMLCIDLKSNGGGDIFLHHNSADWITERILSIYDGGDGGPSTLHTIAASVADATPRHIARHCTHMMSLLFPQAGAMACGELIAGYADQVELTNCLIWSVTNLNGIGFGGHAIGAWFGPDGLATDIALPANVHHNLLFNCNLSESSEAGTQACPGGPGYDCNVTGAPLGANDIYLDPQFRDPTVTLHKWHESLLPDWTGWAGSPLEERVQRNGDALYRLSLKNEPEHPDYDPNFTLQGLLTFCTNGFQPTNEAIFGLGSDGQTMGAVEFDIVTSSSSSSPAMSSSSEAAGNGSSSSEQLPPWPLLTPARIQILKDLYNGGHPWAVTAKTFADTPDVFADLGQWDLLAWLMTDTQQYARDAIAKFIAGMPKVPSDRNTTREYGWFAPCMYIWLHDEMLPSERIYLAELLNIWAAAMMDLHVGITHGTRLDDSDEVCGHYVGIALIDLALGTSWHTRTPGAFGSTKAAQRSAITTFCNRANTADGGDWLESSDYNLGTPQLLILGTMGLDITLASFPEVVTFAQKMGQLHRWMLTYPKTDSHQWGDIEHAHELILYARAAIYACSIAAGGDADGSVRNLMGLMTNGVNPAALFIDLYRMLFIYDPRLTPASPVPDNPQGIYHAGGPGTVYHRDGTQTLSVFHCTPTLVDHAMMTWTIQWHDGDDWLLDHPRGYVPYQTNFNCALCMGINLMPTRSVVEVSTISGGMRTAATTSGGRYDGMVFYQPPRAFLEEMTRTVEHVGDTLTISDYFEANMAHMSGGDPVDLSRYLFFGDQASIENRAANWQQIFHTKTLPISIDGGYLYQTPGGQWMQMLSNAETKSVEAHVYGVNIGQYLQEYEQPGYIIRFMSDALPSVTITTVISPFGGSSLPSSPGEEDPDDPVSSSSSSPTIPPSSSSPAASSSEPGEDPEPSSSPDVSSEGPSSEPPGLPPLGPGTAGPAVPTLPNPSYVKPEVLVFQEFRPRE